MVVKNRLDFSPVLSIFGYSSSSVIGGYLGSLFSGLFLENVSLAQAAGAIIIGNMAVPPLTVILTSALLGGTVMTSIVYIVKSLWDKHNFKAFSFLDRILQYLSEFTSVNNTFINHLNLAQSSLNSMKVNTDQIKRCVVSQRQRKINGHICQKTVLIIEKMLGALQQIADIEDFEKLLEGTGPSLENGKKTVLSLDGKKTDPSSGSNI